MRNGSGSTWRTAGSSEAGLARYRNSRDVLGTVRSATVSHSGGKWFAMRFRPSGPVGGLRPLRSYLPRSPPAARLEAAPGSAALSRKAATTGRRPLRFSAFVRIGNVPAGLSESARRDQPEPRSFASRTLQVGTCRSAKGPKARGLELGPPSASHAARRTPNGWCAIALCRRTIRALAIRDIYGLRTTPVRRPGVTEQSLEPVRSAGTPNIGGQPRSQRMAAGPARRVLVSGVALDFSESASR